jgi:glyoxylase-like metal-dependent hydrolase (beta-lactamase superfamily II)
MEEERALFTGDVVLGAGTAVIPLDGGDMALYLDSLQRLLDLELERIYPGHGPFISKPKEKLREYIDHRAERERAIIDAVARGATTVEQMVEHIYTDTPRYLHPAAGQSVLSHLLKLQSERRAARTLDAGGEEHWAVA